MTNSEEYLISKETSEILRSLSELVCQDVKTKDSCKNLDYHAYLLLHGAIMKERIRRSFYQLEVLAGRP